MEIEKFASKYQIPILNSGSEFPSHYATHSFIDNDTLDQEFLLSTEKTGKKNFNSNIDKFLGSHKYVFFALGKGYLKTKDSMGLVYDPFVLANAQGANLVKNDLLYILNDSGLFESFIRNNIDVLINCANKLNFKARTNLATDKIISDGVKRNYSPLIYQNNNDLQNDYCDLIDIVTANLPPDLSKELEVLLTDKIVEPNEIKAGLNPLIRKYFLTESAFLNTYFDQQKEERLIEIRIPNQHSIAEGLIAIYRS